MLWKALVTLSALFPKRGIYQETHTTQTGYVNEVVIFTYIQSLAYSL